MLNISKTKKLLFFFLCLLLFKGAVAQEDQKDDEMKDNLKDPSETIHILRLKKSYSLGDGISLRSTSGGGGFFTMNQSLQTLYMVSSPNNDFSGMSSTFSFSRARFNMNANIFDKKIEMTIRFNLPANYQSATTGNRTFNSVLQEAYVEYNPSKEHSFNVGLRADYCDSRETRIEGENLGFIDRSAVSGAFDAIFDYGIRYKGHYKLGGKSILKPYLSFTTGDSRSGLQKNFGGFKYGVRVDYLPFDEFSKGGEFYMDDLAREKTPKLVVGLVYSYNNGQSSAFGTNGGRYLYGDINQKVLLPKYFKTGFDYLFKYRGFYSMGSAVYTWATVPPGITGSFKLSGQFTPYGLSSHAIDSTVLSQLDLGSGINFQAGYVFPSDWAIGFRYSYLNDAAGSLNFADLNRHYSLVATKYLKGHDFKIQTQIGYDEFKDNLKVGKQVGNIYAEVGFSVQL